MPSSITAILNYPKLVLWKAGNLGNNYDGFTVNNNIITVSTTHPFSTGDIVYYSPAISGNWNVMYAIRFSSTQLSLATSYDNAISGISASVMAANTSIANIPVIYYPGATPINLITNPLAAYSKSAQSFEINEKVAIDFTVPRWGEGVTYHNVSYWAFGLISDVGNYRLGLMDFLYFTYGDSVSGTTMNTTYRNDNTSKASLTFNFRILLESQRANIQIKSTTNTYITLFTSSILSASIQRIRFFSSIALNNLSITNCTITYL